MSDFKGSENVSIRPNLKQDQECARCKREATHNMYFVEFKLYPTCVPCFEGALGSLQALDNLTEDMTAVGFKAKDRKKAWDALAARELDKADIRDRDVLRSSEEQEAYLKANPHIKVEYKDFIK